MAKRPSPRFPSSRVRRTRAQWAQLVSQHAASGLSAYRFCRERGLNPSLLRRWRLLLADKPVHQGSSKHPTAEGFIELPPLKAAPTAVFELQLVGGATLPIGTSCDLARLGELLVCFRQAGLC